jgi:hypothetical protein
VEPMSALGQSEKSERATQTSALPSKTDIFNARRHVSKVPDAEVVDTSQTIKSLEADHRTEKTKLSEGMVHRPCAKR